MPGLQISLLNALGDCATGRHRWQATAQVGIAICGHCGTLGYCLFCVPEDLPPGSSLRLCRFHRHRPVRLVDCPPASGMRLI